MNEAMKLAGKLDAYARGDEYQRVTEEAAAILRSQAAEIEGWKNDQKENLKNQCDLHAEIERLRVQLAGCGVAAMQNTVSSITARCAKGSYGYSESYAEVCRAVDREIELRAENRKLREALESIALAGMSGSGQESEEGIRNWHAHRAWEFIGIAARALGETK